uniref:PAB1-binding protein 1 n=1 Tax=Talaromyces marneffei PM1 TaxID=1077442 RepID=A0A093VW94_TALMA
MASTANSVPAANRASGNNLNPSQNNGARQPLRTNASFKGADANRRQSASPGDGAQRRSSSQKAWTQGINPITQKASSQPNGNHAPTKSTPSPKPTSPKDTTNTSDHNAHDRLVLLMTSFIGLSATITTKNGEKYSGIFSSSALDTNNTSVLLKMVQRVISTETHANGLSDTTTPFVGTTPDHSMKFKVDEITDIVVNNVTTAEVVAKDTNGPHTGFRTDTDISGSLTMRERNLQRWEPSATDPNVDMSLEGSGATGWDQFEANARLFGATTSYDENIYTTQINRNDPLYKKKQAEAARIAREIEGTATDNPHLREERGHALEGEGQDEEERYSGVRRDANYLPLQTGQPNKYTPPARRQQVAQQPAAISAAATDPAIISAQLAKPEAASEVSTPSKQAAVPTITLEKQNTAPVTTHGTPSDQKTPTPTTATAPLKRPGAAENATSNVETEVLDHFRQFANNEKMRMQELDATKLPMINFKLATPVPKDLVPILAKDPSKQEEIIERAQRQANEKAASKTVPPPAAPVTEQKPASTTPRTTAPRSEAGPASIPPSAPADRQTHHRGRQPYPPQGPHFGMGGRVQPQTFHSGRGNLSTRLADNFRQQKNALGTVPAPLPIHDSRIPPSGPSGDNLVKSQLQTPTSTKFNVQAMEFKPNPAASTFTPGGAGSTGATASPQLSSRGRSVSRTSTPSAFFGNKKPLPAVERPSLKNQCSPIERLKKEGAEQKDKDFTFNGGIPPPYRTAPTWDVAPGNEEKTYKDMFKSTPPSISPQSRSASSSHMPHPPQHPFNTQQNTPNLHGTGGPLHGPPHLQQHPGSHFDDPHRMQLSASTSHMFPSPRLQHAYPSPMGPHAQLAYGQPVPQFYMNQGGQQPGHMRQYPGGPQFINPQNGMGAPMMVQQPSSGPYMGVPQGMNGHYNPQMQMYSPNPSYAYPQHGGPPPQPHSGYPSPSRGAPMMMHQGSQPGQPPQPVMYMNQGQQGPVYAPQQPGGHAPHRGYPQQPQYNSGSLPSQQYPHHQHRGPANNYSPMAPPPPHMQGQQPPAATTNTAEASDDSK